MGRTRVDEILMDTKIRREYMQRHKNGRLSQARDLECNFGEKGIEKVDGDEDRMERQIFEMVKMK